MSNGTMEIRYGGRYGNNLFGYFSARLYCEKNGLNLLTKPPSLCLDILPNRDYGKNPNNLRSIGIGDKSYHSRKEEVLFYGKGNYIWSGLHQYEDIYYNNRDQILSWIKSKSLSNKSKSFVIHIRIDDFISRERHLIISREYYKYCINKYGENYEEIILVKEDSNKEYEINYMNYLIDYIKSINKIPIYNKNNASDDFWTIANADTIISSNSTFCFWATFFSNGKIIAFPYCGIDILPGKKIKDWRNLAIFYQKEFNSNIIIDKNFSENIIDYFDNVWNE